MHSERRVTRSVTTKAARDAVLGTAELLEHILIHLPPKSLLTSRKVCRQFRHGIAKSPRIQEKVFVRLRNKHEYWMYVPGHWFGFSRSRASLSRMRRTNTRPVRDDDRGSAPFLSVLEALNPFYLQTDDHHHFTGQRIIVSPDFDMEPVLSMLLKSKKARHSALDMPFADPPNTRLRYSITCTVGPVTIIADGHSFEREGCTLRTVLDAALHQDHYTLRLPKNSLVQPLSIWSQHGGHPAPKFAGPLSQTVQRLRNLYDDKLVLAEVQFVLLDVIAPTKEERSWVQG